MWIGVVSRVTIPIHKTASELYSYLWKVSLIMCLLHFRVIFLTIHSIFHNARLTQCLYLLRLFFIICIPNAREFQMKRGIIYSKWRFFIEICFCLCLNNNAEFNVIWIDKQRNSNINVMYQLSLWHKKCISASRNQNPVTAHRIGARHPIELFRFIHILKRGHSNICFVFASSQ